jgi:hypothetical protein
VFALFLLGIYFFPHSSSALDIIPVGVIFDIRPPPGVSPPLLPELKTYTGVG